MFTPVLQGNIVTEGLQVYYDGNDLASYNGTGTTVNDLSGNGINGTLSGGTNFRPDTYGGVFEFDGVDDTINYNTVLGAQFTIQLFLTSGTDANPNLLWGSDDGGFPGFRPANNGFVFGTGASFGMSYLIPILWAGTSASTLSNRQAEAGWTGASTYFGFYSFTTNGAANHNSWFNNYTKGTSTIDDVLFTL